MSYLPTMGAALETFTTPGDGVLVYRNVSNVQRPLDEATLRVFQTLQYQLDRAAQAIGASKIAVDGDIGPLTVALAKRVLGSDASDTETVAARADDFARMAADKANAANVPRDIPTPKATKRPSFIGPGGKDIVGGFKVDTGAGASIFDAFATMSDTQKLLLGLGAAGLVGYLYMTRKK